MNEAEEHVKEKLIWQGKDFQNATVNLYEYERDHILEHHGEVMGNNFTAIYDTVEKPKSVYESGTERNRLVFFKMSDEATYTPKFFTKAIVEYNDEKTEGYIVTAMPSKKERGNIGDRVYPEEII